MRLSVESDRSECVVCCVPMTKVRWSSLYEV